MLTTSHATYPRDRTLVRARAFPPLSPKEKKKKYIIIYIYYYVIRKCVYVCVRACACVRTRTQSTHVETT
jgi:hypothetical protein